MDEDASLITPELEALVGREGVPRAVTIDPETVRRVLETVADDDPRWRGEVAPPYVLLAFETDLDLPESPRAPDSLVTGDEWTLHRPLRVGERLTMTGRLAAVHERVGSRYGHTLVLRSTWTFADADGAVAAAIGRSLIRFRPRAEADGVGNRVMGDGEGDHRQQRAGERGLAAQTPSDVSQHPTPITHHLAEGDSLPPLVVTPSLSQVVRYCGLTWNFVPFFYDPDAARRVGLPGPIVPGPLKLALLTRYLSALAGPAGTVRAVRCAHRRPDRTGRPLTIRGLVTRAVDEGSARVLDCEVWTENEAGERSVAGSATIVHG